MSNRCPEPKLSSSVDVFYSVVYSSPVVNLLLGFVLFCFFYVCSGCCIFKVASKHHHPLLWVIYHKNSKRSWRRCCLHPCSVPLLPTFHLEHTEAEWAALFTHATDREMMRQAGTAQDKSERGQGARRAKISNVKHLLHPYKGSDTVRLCGLVG